MRFNIAELTPNSYKLARTASLCVVYQCTAACKGHANLATPIRRREVVLPCGAAYIHAAPTTASTPGAAGGFLVCKDDATRKLVPVHGTFDAIRH